MNIFLFPGFLFSGRPHKRNNSLKHSLNIRILYPELIKNIGRSIRFPYFCGSFLKFII
jgi:hypothetical protein